MRRKQKYLTAGATVLAAAVTAHLMQRSTGAEAAFFGAGPEARATMAIGTTTLPVRVAATAAPTVRTTPAIDDTDGQAADAALSATPPHPAIPAAPIVEAPVLVRAEMPAPAATAAPDPAAAGRRAPDPKLPGAPAPARATAELPAKGDALRDRMAQIRIELSPRGTEGDPGTVRRNARGLPCGLVLTAARRPAAMVDLTLTAPCRGGGRATVRHGALAFDARLDEYGRLQASVPALAADAEFTVAFDDGAEALASVNVPGADAVERVGLYWTGKTGFEIHALEFGADYGDPGHVWREAPRDPGRAGTAGGGFLTRLGDPTLEDPRIAEVYTFPDAASARDGIVRLSIEAAVTEATCGRDVSGQTLQRDAFGTLSPISLTVAMPGCEAVGEYLVLKNLLRDLKIAAN